MKNILSDWNNWNETEVKLMKKTLKLSGFEAIRNKIKSCFISKYLFASFHFMLFRIIFGRV